MLGDWRSSLEKICKELENECILNLERTSCTTNLGSKTSLLYA